MNDQSQKPETSTTAMLLALLAKSDLTEALQGTLDFAARYQASAYREHLDVHEAKALDAILDAPPFPLTDAEVTQARTHAARLEAFAFAVTQEAKRASAVVQMHRLRRVRITAPPEVSKEGVSAVAMSASRMVTDDIAREGRDYLAAAGFFGDDPDGGCDCPACRGGVADAQKGRMSVTDLLGALGIKVPPVTGDVAAEGRAFVAGVERLARDGGEPT